MPWPMRAGRQRSSTASSPRAPVSGVSPVWMVIPSPALRARANSSA